MFGNIIKTAVLLILIAAAIAFARFRKEASVAVIHPARGVAVEAIYATGTVEPSVMLPVAPRFPARLTELLADEGQAVGKGQVLARMEDEDLRKTLAELQAKTALAQKEFDRVSTLSGKGFATRESLDRAQAELQTARAAAARARVNVDYMKLAAPDDGTVIKRDGEVGELIPAGQPVFWLSCCDGLRVAAEVDEEDIASVRTGQKVVMRAEAFPDETFDGAVLRITPKGDPVSRSYRVRVSLPPDTKLMIGMTVETNIVLREAKDALLLPAAAVDGDTVWIVRDDGMASLQKVVTGTRGPDTVEIVKGIDDQSLIVRDPDPDRLKKGHHLRVRHEEWQSP